MDVLEKQELLQVIESESDFEKYVMGKIKTDLQEYFVGLAEEIEKEEELILHGTGKNIYMGIIKA